MNAWVKVSISAVTQFIIAGCGAAVAVLTETDAISSVGIAVAVMTGLISAGKDIQAALMKSPGEQP
jgi:hypothetical protein